MDLLPSVGTLKKLRDDGSPGFGALLSSKTLGLNDPGLHIWHGLQLLVHEVVGLGFVCQAPRP